MLSRASIYRSDQQNLPMPSARGPGLLILLPLQSQAAAQEAVEVQVGPPSPKQPALEGEDGQPKPPEQGGSQEEQQQQNKQRETIELEFPQPCAASSAVK